MKKRFLKILFFAAVAFGFVGCADLDMPSDGRVTLNEIFSTYYRTKNYYQNCIGGIPQFGFTYQNQTTPLASFCDEAQDASDRTAGAVYNWYNGTTSPTYNPLTASYYDPWDHYFTIIRRCNTFLQCIVDPEIATYNFTETEKNGWIAEVRVVRAFAYLQLFKRYGQVPLMDVPYEVTHDFSQDTKATIEEIADFIISECDAALATPESEGQVIGFRWAINDNERGKITRGFAQAVKSQTALFAASPLFAESGTKYTWAKAAEITKDALDKCLAHGYELYKTEVDPGVAQNPYAYYFIQVADPSRSVDKETIYESTEWRTNVWKNAGTPNWDGMVKAGPCPSQELVDSYNMANGEMPILGYSDADHLQPIINPASGYNPQKPYENRDPRFYASIYYNESDRTLAGAVEKDIIPLYFYKNWGNQMQVTINDDWTETHIVTTGGDPYVYSYQLGEEVKSAEIRQIAFESKCPENMRCEFFFAVAGGPEGGKEIWFNIPKSDDWVTVEIRIEDAINNWGFGKSNHFLRFDLPDGSGHELTIRDPRIESFTPPPAPQKVETYVGGNCEISDRVTDTRFTRTGYYLRKFNNYRSNVNVDADGLMKIFRLGELYLNFAEAAYNSTGNPDAQVSGMSAREAVNAIRDRAGIPGLPAGLSKDDFEARYRNERRVELAFEEHRFFDVRRWKILDQTDNFVTGMKITKNSDETFSYQRFKLSSRPTGNSKYLYYPIKQSEVSKMNAFTGIDWQNPGWN